MKKFFKRRETRKFIRSKTAVISLVVILTYIGIGLSVFFGAVTLEEIDVPIGPRNLPGFGMHPPVQKRVGHQEFYLDQVDAALERIAKGREPSMDLGPLRLAESDPEELGEKLEGLFEFLDEIDEFDELEGNAEVAVILDKLDEGIVQLFAPLSPEASRRLKFHSFLGTDQQGRSILLRAMFSTKIAIQVGLVTAFLSVIIGTLLGAAAGFYGGVTDVLVMWLFSTFSSIPNIVLLTVLAFMFTGGALDGTLIPIYVAFCATFWIGPCRVIRGEVLKLKNLEYVQAATAIGFSRFYILIKHVIPNTAHLMFINFSLLFIGAIKSEVILSYLGLGIKAPTPSWGLMISNSGAEVLRGFFWQIGTATFFMFGLVLAFNIVSDTLQDAFDPKHV